MPSGMLLTVNHNRAKTCSGFYGWQMSEPASQRLKDKLKKECQPLEGGGGGWQGTDLIAHYCHDLSAAQQGLRSSEAA